MKKLILSITCLIILLSSTTYAANAVYITKAHAPYDYMDSDIDQEDSITVNLNSDQSEKNLNEEETDNNQ